MQKPNLAQLQKAVALAEEIESLKAELASILGGSSIPAKVAMLTSPTGQNKRTMSAAGRARIAAAQKLRWAKVNTAKGPVAKSVKAPAKKGKVSAAHRAKLAAAAKARWARIKAGKEQSPFGKR